MAHNTKRLEAKFRKGEVRSDGARSRRLHSRSFHPLHWVALAALIAISLGQSSCPQMGHIDQPLVPDAAAPGGPAFTLTLNGSDFTANSSVNWNSTSLPATSNNGSQLKVSVPASLIATPGTASVSVTSGSGGALSNVVYFPVWRATSPPIFVSASGSPIAVGSGPDAVAVGDFNGDGKPDLAVANGTDGTVSILLGNGDGTFTLAPGSPIKVGGDPDAVAVGDFNIDDKLDLAVANAKDGTVSILLGNGNGTFTLAKGSPIAVGTDPDALAVGDFNADGNPDIAVANKSSNNVTILQGNGDGTFNPATGSPITVSTGPSALAVGNFGNGNLSLAVANGDSNNVSILLGNGDGTFTAAKGSPIPVGGDPDALAAADFNGDGNLDLAVANATDGTVSILLGDGSGGFKAAAGSPIAVGNAPSSLAVGDFNTDTKLDLAVANMMSNNVSILLGKGDGTFTLSPSPATTGNGPSSLAVGDFNGDGRLDLAATNSSDNSVSILVQPIGVVSSTKNLSFPAQGLNTMSTAQTLTISNNTTKSVNLSAINVTGTDASQFKIQSSGTTCSTSTPLVAGGGTCTISVAFAPTMAGTLTASLDITTSSTNTPSLTIGLTGIGSTGGQISLEPVNVSFGDQSVGTASNPQVVTLSNVGPVPVAISAIATSVSAFAIISPTSGATACQSLVGSSLAIGASCVIPVTFTPSKAGVDVGSLTITDDAAGTPQSVTLTGTGTFVQISPASLNFGGETIGSTSNVQNLTLENVGTTPLTFAGITASTDFALASDTTCSVSTPVAGGASCIIGVTFTPTRAGDITGTLVITDSDFSSPQKVGLSGVGQDFKFAAFVTSQTVQPGGITNYMLTLSPEDGFNGSVKLTCSDAPLNATCSVTPSSVTLSGSTTTSITLHVKTSGSSLIQSQVPLLPFGGDSWPIVMGFGLLGLVGIMLITRLRREGKRQTSLRRWAGLVPLAVIMAMMLMFASCGSRGPRPVDFGTPPGTYTLKVTASAGSLSHSTTVQLVVK